MIDSFQLPETRFLSNMFPHTVAWNGKLYPSTENAYQAAKAQLVDNMPLAQAMEMVTPRQSKTLAKRLELPDAWHDIKWSVMSGLVQQKFRNPLLLEKLLATGDQEIIEGNTWGDTYWGVCNGTGQNHLGKILMTIRNQERLQRAFE